MVTARLITTPLITTAWQLIAGGTFLLPLALVAERLPSQPLTGQNLLGYGISH